MYDIEPGDPLRIQNKLSIYNVLVIKKTSETGQLQRVPNGDAPTLAAQYPKRPIIAERTVKKSLRTAFRSGGLYLGFN